MPLIRSLGAFPQTAFASLFPQQLHVGYRGPALHGFHHIVNSEGCHRGGGQRLHLDTSRPGGPSAGKNLDAPFLPVDLQRTKIWMPPPSKPKSSFTDLSMIWWQRGISSEVFLAPIIPATRATASTSPLAALPSLTRCIVSRLSLI